jgi:hypothetical protein
MAATTLYEHDVYAWAMHTATLLREKRFNELDIEHLAEEIESVGASERRELQNRLEVLIAHLLKLHYLSQLRAQNERGWQATIREQRRKIKTCLQDNPSLKPKLETMLLSAYPDAVDQVIAQVGVDESLFPSSCPYRLEQVLDGDF